MKGFKKDGKFHPIRNKRSPSKNRKKKFENAKIQSLIFPKKGSNKFTNTTALAWASDHGFKAVKIEPTKNTLRIRQFSPNKIKRGTECKTIQFGGSGVQGVLCDTPDKFKRERYAKIERKKRFLSEDDVDRLSHLELNALLIDVEKRWRKKELHSLDGDHQAIIYTCIEHPEYTFEIHPMDDNELEDEHGKELKEPIFHDAWFWFPAKHGKGVPNSPTTMSETGGYTRKDAIREFTKELIIFDQGMNP